MDNFNDTFKEVMKKFKKNLSKASFDMWMKDIKFISKENDIIKLSVPSDYEKKWIDFHYKKDFIDSLFEIYGKKFQIEFILENNNSKEALADKNIDTVVYGTLLEKYTFDNFVIGSANLFAHAACFAVAADPGKAYNPLFIYGGSGLGKTHLLQAIGNSVKENYPNKKVVYLSSEKFTNEFIKSISENKSEQFRQKYRQVDILLIDDIQFLSKKIGTQEEFFHTFNTLYESGKQIVISSDRPPSEIQALEERLRSRFGWGLITDISAPDLETRVAILHKKAKSDGLEINNDVLLLIANCIDTNVRELEGALTRVLAFSSLLNQDIDVSLAEKALKNLISTNSTIKNISAFDIQKIICSHFNIKTEDLLSKNRSKNISFPRQIAMYLSREITGLSFPKIGEEFGGRDHSTVMHACEKIKKKMSDDLHFKKQVENIIKNLKT